MKMPKETHSIITNTVSSGLLVLIFSLFFWGALSCDITYAAEEEADSAAFNQERFQWFDAAFQAADSLLSEREMYIFEGKLALIALEKLRKLKSTIFEEGTVEQKQKYVELERKLIAVLQGVEQGIISTLTLDEWTRLRNEYENERGSLVQEVSLLNDSLVTAYSQMFSDPSYLKMMRNLEQPDIVEADFIFRIGLLYLEQSERIYDEESIARDDLADYLSDIPDAEIPPEPVKNFYKAERQFYTIIDKYPDSPYIDDAYYNIIYIKTQSAEQSVQEQIIRLLADFADKFPDSPYYPEVQMRMAEYYFNPAVNDMASAIEHYKIVAEYPESRYHNNALYRLGWSYYQEKDFIRAVDYFSRTIDLSLEETAAGGYSMLMDESIDLLGESFTSDTLMTVSAIDSAVAYLQQDPMRLELFGDRLLKRMGDIYQNDLGYYHKAIEAYSTYLRLYPESASAPRIHEKVIKIYDEILADKDMVFEKKYELFRNYRPESAWRQAQSDSIGREGSLLAEKNLRDIVEETVRTAMEAKRFDNYRLAADLCSVYVEYFPNTEKTYRINNNLAFLLARELKDYIRGCQENIKITRRYPPGKYHEQCAIEAIECALNLMEIQSADSSFSLPPASQIAHFIPPEVIARIPYLGNNPLSQAEILYLMAIQNYLDIYPEGSQTETYLLNAGNLYYQHEKYQASRHYLNQLVRNFPHSPRCDEAKRFILDGYYRAKDFRNAEKYAREINASEVSGELKELAEARIGESINSYAEVLKNNNNFIAAGSEYKRAALEMSDIENASNTLWESGRQFQAASAWDSSIVSYELLVKKAPKSKWADKSLNNIAFIYQNRLNDRRKAAETFERLADSYPESDIAQTALNNARVNYTALKDFRGALKVNEKYLEKYPNAEDAVAILYENARLYLDMDELPRAISAFSDFTRRFPDDPRNVQANYEIGKYYLNQGDEQLAEKSFSKAVESHRALLNKKQSGFPRFASFSLSHLLKKKFEKYLAIKYRPLNSIARNRARKQELRDELNEDFKELISYQQKEAVEAYYNICRLDEELASSELNQAMPALSGDQLIIKREEILDKSLGLYQDALVSYNSALQAIAKWDSASHKLERDYSQRVDNLNDFIARVPEVQPDSAMILLDLQRELTEIDTSLELIADFRERCEIKIDSCKINIVYIYYDDAKYNQRSIETVLNIPDEGHKRTLKMLFRLDVLGQLFIPKALDALEHYNRVYSVLDTIDVSTSWKDSADVSTKEIIQQIFDEYNELVGRAARRYRINLISFRQRVKDGDISAIDISDAPLRYLGYSKEFVDSMYTKINLVMDWTHGNPHTQALNPYLDSLYTGSLLKYHNKYVEITADNEKYHDIYTGKYESTADDLYLEGMDLFEMINDEVELYRYDLLEFTVYMIETYSIANNEGDFLLREMVKLAPSDFGYLVGLAAEGQKVLSGVEWKVGPDIISGFERVDFDDSGWSNAVLIVRAPVKIEVVPDSIDSTFIQVDSTVVADSVSMVDSLSLGVITAVADSGSVIDSLSLEGMEQPPAEEEITSVPDPEFDYTALDELGAPPIWNAEPVEKLSFRRHFEIDGKPFSGSISISVDDDYAIFINGEFVGDDSKKEMDWETPENYSVVSFLRNGTNVIAVEAFDPDLTGQGFWFKLDYAVMPESIDDLPIVRSKY